MISFYINDRIDSQRNKVSLTKVSLFDKLSALIMLMECKNKYMKQKCCVPTKTRRQTGDWKIHLSVRC